MKRSTLQPRRQRGAMLITAALVMFLLLGFIAIALDFGRLFVIKSELQTAMDSCALAAAQELDKQPTALIRAANAGKTASDLNRVDFQSGSWGGLALLDKNTEITFFDVDYNPTTSALVALYAQCQHTHTGSRTWLLQALGAFSGNPALAQSTKSVYASAVAIMGAAQTTCPVPLALRPKTSGATGPNYGYQVGEWVTLLTKDDTGENGYVGWANLDGTNSAANTAAEMNGYCNVTIGTNLGTPGVQSSIADNWNWRFGIYKGGQSPTDQTYMLPDQTGYIYNDNTWPRTAPVGSPDVRNAYNGAPPPGHHSTAQNYDTHFNAYANCYNTTTGGKPVLNDCIAITGLDLHSFQRVLPGGSGASGHQAYGQKFRRVVMVPVTNGYPGSVADYVCMLLLQPLEPGLPRNVQLEFLGNATPSAPGVVPPCVTGGLPGGVTGPQVPVLVR